MFCLENNNLIERKKQTKPKFFECNSKDKGCNFIIFNTPMDFLFEIVDKAKTKANPTKRIDMSELINKNKTANKPPDRKMANRIEKIAEKIHFDLKMAKSDIIKDEEDYNYEKYSEYRFRREEILCEGINAVAGIKLRNIETMKLLLSRCYSDTKKKKKNEIQEYKTTLTNLLYKAHTKLFVECF